MIYNIQERFLKITSGFHSRHFAGQNRVASYTQSAERKKNLATKNIILIKTAPQKLRRN